MNKTVFLLRHGKSDWGADYAQDVDRPLSRRGVKAARLMGRCLTRLEQLPDQVISSPALRALATAKLAMESGGWSCPIQVVDDLYGGSPSSVLEVIQGCPDAIDRVLITGHEPTWSEAVGELTGGSSVRFPTAALARIDLPREHWRDTRFGTGTLMWLLPPRVAAKLGGS